MQTAPLWLNRATLPGQGHVGGEAGIEVAGWIDDAQAIRPDQAEVPAGDVAHALLQQPALGPEFRKPC